MINIELQSVHNYYEIYENEMQLTIVKYIVFCYIN